MKSSWFVLFIVKDVNVVYIGCILGCIYRDVHSLGCAVIESRSILWHTLGKNLILLNTDNCPNSMSKSQVSLTQN